MTQPGLSKTLLERQNHPFFCYEFLSALEESGSVSPTTGQLPIHISFKEFFCPLYLKGHSYGEYIFDWDWAKAYQAHGIDYYPKVVNYVPFSPVVGDKWIGDISKNINSIENRAHQHGAQSIHFLYSTKERLAPLLKHGYFLRTSFQFQWVKTNEKDFNDYLSQMKSRKRKSIKKERVKANEKFSIKRVIGVDLAAHADFVFECYQRTVNKKWSHQYLNKDFFIKILSDMNDRVLLVVARDRTSNQPVAMSLNLYDSHTLYGRYWGHTLDDEQADCLHFECCYYQQIEFCIEQGIQEFHAGAQGFHKLSRGLFPRKTYSAHKLFHPEFHRAVQDFVKKEEEALNRELQESRKLWPFNEQALDIYLEQC